MMRDDHFGMALTQIPPEISEMMMTMHRFDGVGDTNEAIEALHSGCCLRAVVRCGSR